MQHEECIIVRFSEGLGIFDRHYGYPEIDNKEIYDGALVRLRIYREYRHMQDVIFSSRREKSLASILTSVHTLHIAIKAEKDTDTCLFLMVHDQKSYDYIRRFVVIGKTPKGDSGCYDVIKDGFTGFAIKDDGEWHEYDCDTKNNRRRRQLFECGQHPYYPVLFADRTGEHTFHFNELSSTTVDGVKIYEQ